MSTLNNDDIFIACRKGDFERVKYLTEEKEVNLNVRDKWDSTPLYYACLCGHPDVVSYLLENGARCEASTFDGERCIYGALTNQIKKMLVNYSVISSRVKRREPFQEFLRRLLEDACESSDITFIVHGVHIKVHKFILAARSTYFEQQFKGRWKDREVVSINNHLVDSSVFYHMIEWLYTGQVKLGIDQLEDALKLCKQCHLNDFADEILTAFAKADEFVATKRGTKIKTVCVESKESQRKLAEDLSVLAMLTLPSEFQFQWHYWMELPMGPKPPGTDEYTDVVFKVQSSLFRCHQAMFCTRSDYFRALINDHFNESSWDSTLNLPVVQVHNVDPMVFAVVVTHVYSNNQHITIDNVYDLMEVAEMFFLPDLKRHCGLFLAKFIEEENAVDLLSTARLFNVPRLEHHCIEFLAKNIEDMISNEKFVQLVKNDAQNVKSRQETDSIDIIDDIRYVLRSVNSLASIAEAENSLDVLESFLEDLELDC